MKPQATLLLAEFLSSEVPEKLSKPAERLNCSFHKSDFGRKKSTPAVFVFQNR